MEIDQLAAVGDDHGCRLRVTLLDGLRIQRRTATGGSQLAGILERFIFHLDSTTRWLLRCLMVNHSVEL
jgi:hypothetical protein